MTDDRGPEDGSSERVATSRRRYVALLAGLSTTALAGCGGGGDGDDGGDGGADGDDGADGTDGETSDGGSAGGDGDGGDETTATETAEPTGPAAFEDLTIETPDDPSVGETTLSVSVTNVGGETGTFEGTLRATGAGTERTASVTLDAVDPGGTASTDVTLSFGVAGDYALALNGEDARASGSLSVGPAAAGTGDAIPLGNDATATLTDVEFANGLFVETIQRNYSPDVDAVLYPDDGDLFAVLRFDVENGGSEALSIGSTGGRYGSDTDPFDLGPGQVGIGAGRFVTSYRVAGYTRELSDLQRIDGETLYDREVPAGETATGWLVVELPDAAREEGLPLTYQRDDASTPPEARWRIGADGLPSLSLSEWTLPSKAEQGRVDHEFTVANDGDAAGRVGVAIGPFGDRVSATVAPGESHTFEHTIVWPYSETRTVNLRPFAERELELTAQQLAVGEGGTTPWGTATVEQVVTTDQIDGTATNGDDGPWAPRNDTFVLVQITHDRSVDVPVGADDPNYAQNVLRVEVGEESYDFHSTSDDSGAHVAEFSEPVVGSWGPAFVENGDSETGWIAFDVAGDVSAADLTVRGRYQDGCRLEWRAE